MTEKQMVELIVNYFKRINVPVCTEVGFLSRSLDLVFRKDNQLIAVEIKRHDWKTALKQAKTHYLGADEVYVCILPRKSISEKMKEEFRTSKIGLMFFRKNDPIPFEKIIPYPGTENGTRIFRDWLLKTFEESLRRVRGNDVDR